MNKEYAILWKKSPIEDKEDRTIVAIGSTEDIDRAKEVIEINAWNIDNYLKNPVILLNHNPDSLPIGKALWVKKDKRGLLFKIQFADTTIGNEVYKLYKDGIMNTFSVGFKPKKATRNMDGVRVFEDVELLELSCVTIPCNPNAVVLEKSYMNEIKKKDINSDELYETLKKYVGDIMKDFEKALNENETKDTELEETKTEDATEETQEKMVNPVKATTGKMGVANLFHKIASKLESADYEETEEYFTRVILEDVYPTEYPNGVCVVNIRTISKESWNTLSEKFIEYTYNIQDEEIFIESEKEVEPVFAAKMVTGTNLKSDRTIVINNKNDNSEVLNAITSLLEQFKNLENITNINSEAIKILSKAEPKKIAEPKIVKEAEEKPEETADSQETIKKLLEDFNSGIAEAFKKNDNDFRKAIEAEWKKQLGKI